MKWGEVTCVTWSPNQLETSRGWGGQCPPLQGWRKGARRRRRKSREEWLWDIQAVSNLDIGHRVSLSEMLETLVSARAGTREKVIWQWCSGMERRGDKLSLLWARLVPHGGGTYAWNRPSALSSPQGEGWDLGIWEGLWRWIKKACGKATVKGFTMAPSHSSSVDLKAFWKCFVSLRSPWWGELVFSCWRERRAGGLACPGSPFESE